MLSLCNIKMLAVRLYNEHSYVRLLLMASKKKEEGGEFAGSRQGERRRARACLNLSYHYFLITDDVNAFGQVLPCWHSISADAVNGLVVCICV